MNPIPADDLLIRPAHLMLALNLSASSVAKHLAKGNIPKPDAIGPSRQSLWRLETIEVWNPDVAETIRALLSNPAFAPRSIRKPGPGAPLLNAA